MQSKWTEPLPRSAIWPRLNNSAYDRTRAKAVWLGLGSRDIKAWDDYFDNDAISLFSLNPCDIAINQLHLQEKINPGSMIGERSPKKKKTLVHRFLFNFFFFKCITFLVDCTICYSPLRSYQLLTPHVPLHPYSCVEVMMQMTRHLLEALNAYELNTTFLVTPWLQTDGLHWTFKVTTKKLNHIQLFPY